MSQGGQKLDDVAQIIYAPNRPGLKHKKRIFLAGYTKRVGGTAWRETLISALSQCSVTIFDPYRSDWDSSWVEDMSYPPFREQVNWELDMQEIADLVVVCFHPDTPAPISLLELGLCAPKQKALVVCPPGYWKRGNVQAVCQRFGIEMLDDEARLTQAAVRILGLEVKAKSAA